MQVEIYSEFQARHYPNSNLSLQKYTTPIVKTQQLLEGAALILRQRLYKKKYFWNKNLVIYF